MAVNRLTPEQDLAVREFFVKVVNVPACFPGDESTRKQAFRIVLGLLNYVMIDNKFVDPAKVTSVRYGQQNPAVDEWDADTRAAEDALNEINRSASANEANNSKSSEGSEVREAVLREDV